MAIGIVAACGARTSLPPGTSGGVGKFDAGIADALEVDPTLAFTEMEARARELAPLMREVGRVEQTVGSGAGSVFTYPAAERDTCVRAFVAARSPVRVKMEDDAKNASVESADGAAGIVPEAGPFCVRKGSVVRLVVTSPNANFVRVIVLASP